MSVVSTRPHVAGDDEIRIAAQIPEYHDVAPSLRIKLSREARGVSLLPRKRWGRNDDALKRKGEPMYRERRCLPKECLKRCTCQGCGEKRAERRVTPPHCENIAPRENALLDQLVGES